MRKGEGSEVCYCVAWKVRGGCVPGCVGVIVFSTYLTLFNHVVLCDRACESKEKIPFNCYDCNGHYSILNLNLKSN